MPPCAMMGVCFSSLKLVCAQRKNYVQLQQNHLLCVHRYSVTKGWQLLWLCTGLFPPSKSLLKHAQKFVETRKKEPLAMECSRRIQTVMRYTVLDTANPKCSNIMNRVPENHMDQNSNTHTFLSLCTSFSLKWSLLFIALGTLNH